MVSIELKIAEAVARDNLPERECRKCGELKGLGEFPRHVSTRDGLSTRCKVCNAAKCARYRAANAEKVREYNTRYRAENAEELRERKARYYAENAEKVREYRARYRAENAEKVREYNARYYVENAEKERERVARYRAENAEKERERAARYRAENPEVFRAAKRRRRARKALVPHIPYDAERFYSEPCYLCGASADAIEHVYPLARWWDPRTADAAYNVLPVCTSCNSGKRDRDPIEHWNSLGFRPFDRVVFADLCEWVGDPDYVTVYRVE